MSGRYRAWLGAYLGNMASSFSLRPYTDILFVTEGAEWVTSWEIRELRDLAKDLGIDSRCSGPIPLGLPRQSVFFANKYVVLAHPRRHLLGRNRIAFPYYHGRPDSDVPLFRECYENLKRFHGMIHRIQAPNSPMKDLVLSSGIDPAKVFLIPIGINMDFFRRQTGASRKAMRDKYGIPRDDVVIGSFQKDGNGWGEGDAPKLTKGPDVFLEAMRIMKESIPDVFVLLSGPARGFVKKGLERMKVPYKHIFLDYYPKIGELYQCLDLYMVASREEGGPKAILESMACGIPLVTTRVGQALDLVRHGENGWMVDVEDAEALAYWGERALTDRSGLGKILDQGFRTAQSNTYRAQAGVWKEFFQGFVEPS